MVDLASEYRRLHADQPNYGTTDRRLAAIILPLLRSLKAKSVIDYGCGKGALGSAIKEAAGVNVYLYDPYVPKFSKQPDGQFDFWSILMY